MSASPDARGASATRSNPQRADPAEPSATYVDVGLTAYRRVTFIDEAIGSVLAQTYPHWRLTICDNGLGGGDVERAAQPYLDDPRVSYRATGRELVQADNWTNALNQGTGPYVAVLNDDDRWHPGYLAARVEALEAHPECGFACSEWVQIDEGGVEIMRAPAVFAEGVLPRLRSAQWLIRHNAIVPPAIVIRRSACDAVGPFFDPTWQYFDWELWSRLAARYPVYYLARQDNDFRRHSAAFTYSEREPPEQLVAMFDHLERVFTREVEGFRLSSLDRARIRSQILLRAAADVFPGIGWKGSGPTYRRALREYPPAFFDRISLTLLAKSLLGKRGTRLVAWVLDLVRPQRNRVPSA